MPETELLRLVIADDEAYMRENLAGLFPWEELGFVVCAVCGDGVEAFDALLRYKADVVLTDIRMPGWSGIDLARMIRDREIPAEIVFLSAYSDFDYARQGIFYDVVDYLVKPVRYEELSGLFAKLRTDLLTSRQTPKHISSPEDTALIKISAYIRTTPALSTIDACGEATGLSSAYISELVKQQLGLTFTEFVYREKMILAGELLHNIGLQINTVAEMTGYTNAKNFSRAFHNYYRLTPMQYRKQGGIRHETTDYCR